MALEDQSQHSLSANIMNVPKAVEEERNGSFQFRKWNVTIKRVVLTYRQVFSRTIVGHKCRKRPC
jgi:hypothetical protein